MLHLMWDTLYIGAIFVRIHADQEKRRDLLYHFHTNIPMERDYWSEDGPDSAQWVARLETDQALVTASGVCPLSMSQNTFALVPRPASFASAYQQVDSSLINRDGHPSHRGADFRATTSRLQQVQTIKIVQFFQPSAGLAPEWFAKRSPHFR
jgi:hypothetical protein